jgi:hypothetical protein
MKGYYATVLFMISISLVNIVKISLNWYITSWKIHFWYVKDNGTPAYCNNLLDNIVVNSLVWSIQLTIEYSTTQVSFFTTLKRIGASRKTNSIQSSMGRKP